MNYFLLDCPIARDLVIQSEQPPMTNRIKITAVKNISEIVLFSGKKLTQKDIKKMKIPKGIRYIQYKKIRILSQKKATLECPFYKGTKKNKIKCERKDRGNYEACKKRLKILFTEYEKTITTDYYKNGKFHHRKTDRKKHFYVSRRF